jgi:hypothetical protein
MQSAATIESRNSLRKLMVLPLLEVDFPEPTQGATEISAYRPIKLASI